MLGRVVSRCRPSCATSSLLTLCTFANKITGCIRLLVSTNTAAGAGVLGRVVGTSSVFLNRNGTVLVRRFKGSCKVCFSVLSTVTHNGASHSRVRGVMNERVNKCLAGLRGRCRIVTGGRPVFRIDSAGGIHCAVRSGFFAF